MTHHPTGSAELDRELSERERIHSAWGSLPRRTTARAFDDDRWKESVLRSRIRAVERVFRGFDLHADVVTYAAHVTPSSLADLRHAVNQLLAYWVLSGPVSLGIAKLAVREPPKNKVTIERIQRIVARHFDVSYSALLSRRGPIKAQRPRQVAIYLSKILTHQSFPEIGRMFDHRDHTTVLEATQRIEDILNGTNTAVRPRHPCLRRPGDETLAADIAALKERLME